VLVGGLLTSGKAWNRKTGLGKRAIVTFFRSDEALEQR
jgi:hypothetical protein